MSLLTKPTPTQLTDEAKLQALTARVKDMSRQSYKNITDIQKRGIDMVWSNPNFTAQEIIDALGEDALKIFQYHGALTEYLVTIAQLEGIQPDIKLPKNAFTVSQTTITVTEDPYQA